MMDYTSHNPDSSHTSNSKWADRMKFCREKLQSMLHKAGIYDTHTLDDLVSKSILVAWVSNFDRLVDPAKGCENALLYTICRFQFLMYLRTRKRDRHRFLDAADRHAFDRHLQINRNDQVVRENSMEDRLYIALASLPIEHQIAIREYLLLDRLPRSASNEEKSHRVQLRLLYCRALKLLRILIPRTPYRTDYSRLSTYKRCAVELRVN